MPGLLIGALMQFDFADETSGLLGSDVEGRGWLAGPYISARLSENIYFDARAAWGRSENDVSPFGTYTDRVGGDRWLARADLTGEWRWDRWRAGFRPRRRPARAGCPGGRPGSCPETAG